MIAVMGAQSSNSQVKVLFCIVPDEGDSIRNISK